jgi:NAD(P)-dependent dehydrogenase (short-subunit alcohol dehydrogenase family)
MSDNDLSGRVVLITGAASGIGRRTAERLHAIGAHVVALDREVMPGEFAQEVVLDVTSEDAWRLVVSNAMAEFGRIDGLVSCAGIIAMGNIVDTPFDQFRRVMAVNVEGCFLGIKHVLPAMLTAGHGSIVNISSTAGIAGAPGAGAYCASKGAVRMLTKAAALEALAAGSKVRVNSVHPAMTETPMIATIVDQLGGDPAIEADMRAMQPSGRFVTPDAVADMILFLLTDRSIFVNGAEMLVDNGFTAQ